MTPPDHPASPATPETSSNAEQSTPDHDASSAAQVRALLSAATTSSTRKASPGLELARLSPEKQATLQIIGETAKDGWSGTEIAQALGVTPSWVSERLSGLRQEMLAQTGILRPLNPAELESLHSSILQHGVQNPIHLATVDGKLELIDGHHRLLIADQLGVSHDVQWIHLGDLTADTARELRVALNADRRQLTNDEKKILVDAELMRDPARSDRWIGRICGVTHPTVAGRRTKIADDVAELAQHSEAPDTDPLEVLTSRPASPVHPPARVGLDGRSQGGTRAPTAPPAREAAPVPPAPQALACPACGCLLDVHENRGARILKIAA